MDGFFRNFPLFLSLSLDWQRKKSCSLVQSILEGFSHVEDSTHYWSNSGFAREFIWVYYLLWCFQIWARLCVNALCKIVAYFPRQLKLHEKNYSTHNLKLVIHDLKLEIVSFSLKIWSNYLYWLHMDVFIVHKCL